MPTSETTQRAIAVRLTEHLPLDEAELTELIETPPSAEMGDYALPCFTLARRLRKAPQAIAQELAEVVSLPDVVREARATGPYLNFFLDRPLATGRLLQRIREAGPDYRGGEQGRGQRVVIEYSSPNIAKHLGVHHLPGTVIGQALCHIFRALGYDVTALNFLGDWGTGFGRLIAAVERYGVDDVSALSVEDLQDLYVRYSREAEEDPELVEAARAASLRLEQGEERAVRYWTTFRSASLAEFERVYGRIGVSFDRYTPESEYRERMDEALADMIAAGVAVESEGAMVVQFDGEDMPPVLVRTSDGRSLYATRDVAAAIDRWDSCRFERSIYVVGNEQSLHLNQLKSTLKQMGHDWADRMVHVSFGLIRFRDEETGETRKGSTRKGDMLLMEEVLDEAVERAKAKIEENLDRFEPDADLDALAAQVGIGAVLFRELSVRRTRDVVFDWGRMLDFEGDTGPYVQYAHARLCSILRKADEELADDADWSLLALPEEWTLVRYLARYPEVLARAAREFEPSLIANYLLELCADFSAYYSAGMRDPATRVLCEHDPTRAARLLLVNAIRQVIHDGLGLLGVAAPERM